ncbi:MAG: TIGR02450 family Trp-rich protein [Bdellovibrio sp.]|nr:TIGR02450 family Trp-rich protein [Methylotenera sp.]
MTITLKSIPRNPKKLLNSKWTAVRPSNKEKHFMVVKLIAPEQPTMPIEWVELEAVHSKCTQILAWRALIDPANWLQGWQ